MSRRMDRINVLLRQEISQVLVSELKDPRLASLVSVTRVDTSPDLRLARVYVSVLGDSEDKTNTLVALASASGYVRKCLGRSVSFRTAPAVEFRLDDAIEQGSELLKLIDEVSPGTEAGCAEE